MWGIFRGCLSLALLFVSQFSFAIDNKADQLAATNAFIMELKIQYGLQDFKTDEIGVRLEDLQNKYAGLIERAQTLEESLGWDPPVQREVLPRLEFQQLMIGLATDVRDGHTNIARQAGDVWTLGLNTVSIDGRLYVTGFQNEFFMREQSTERIQVGDEITELDGQSVQFWAKRNLLYSQRATFETRYDSALRRVVEVPSRILRPKTQGQTAVVKLQRGKQTITAHLPWVATSDYYMFRQMFSKEPVPALENGEWEDVEVPYGSSGMVRSYFRQGLLNMPSLKFAISDIGAMVNQELTHTKGKSTADQSESDADIDTGSKSQPEPKPVTRLKAYVIHYKGKRIAVLRVPDYSPGGWDAILNETRWMKRVIQYLNEQSDMMILDVLSNAGGSVFEVWRLVSMFASEGEPLPGMIANHRLSETFVNRMKPSSRQFERNDHARYVEWGLEKRLYEDLRAKFERGEKWSGPMPMFPLGVQTDPGKPNYLFGPTDVKYKHPVLPLNDRFSGSGGDFGPAQIQAARRGFVMGEVSMGLGASLYRSVDSMPGSEMFMRCASNSCMRSDGLFIENLGVPVDIPRHIDVADLKNGFADYAEDVLEVALGVIAKKNRSELQEILNARLRSRRGKQEPAKAVKDVQKLIEKYQKATEGLQDALDWTTAVAKYWPAIVKKGADLTADQWRDITLPLPRPLVAADTILSGLWRRAEVLERLDDMRKLPRLQHDANLLELIDFIREWGNTFTGEIRFAEPCKLLLLDKLWDGTKP